MSDESENTTVEGMVQKQKFDVFKLVCYAAGVAVYVAGVVYAETHGFAMLSKGVSADFYVWAVVGMLAVGITALVLPVMLVKVIKDTLQWWICFAFYLVDVAIMAANAAVDFMTNTGGNLPEWGLMYASWILPLTPIIVAGGWLLDFLLDPDVRKRLKLAAVETALANIRLNQTIKHMSTKDSFLQIDGQAQIDSDLLLMANLGQPVFRNMPHPTGARVVIPGTARPVAAQPPKSGPRHWFRSAAKKRPAEQEQTDPTPDLAGLLAALAGLGVDPKALAELLAKQPAQAGGYALDIEGLGSNGNRPNVDLGKVTK